MPRDPILDAQRGMILVRAQEQAKAQMRTLQLAADAHMTRARGLRAHAGNARMPVNRWLLMGMAHHLERKAGKALRELVALRKLHKQADAGESGHRSARRMLDREQG